MEQGTDRRLFILAGFAIVAVAVVAAILISRGGGSDDSSTAASAGGCKEVEVPAPKKVSFKAPPQTVKKGEKVTAAVETSCGSFDIALDTSRAPKTANSFVYLSEKGFYDGLDFPRIAPGFVIQGGSPSNSTLGDPGYKVVE